MSDTAAAPAAAPSAPVAASPVASAQQSPVTPTSSPVAAQTPTSAPSTPRAPDGRFLPRDGQGEPPAPEAPAETAAQAAARRRLALKVRGEEHALDLDDATAAQLARLYGVSPDRLEVALQKDVYGDRAIKEGRQAQEQARRLLEALRSSPEDALAELGVDVDALALKRLQAAARQEAMTPEERAFAEREQALAEREARLRAIEEQAEAKNRTAAEQQAFETVQRDVLSALQENGLPRSHRTIRMVADVMLGAQRAGIALTPAQVAAEVRAEIDGLSDDYLGAMPEDALGQRVGPRLQSMPVERLVSLLGPRLRDVLQHTVAQQRARAGVVQHQAAPSAPPASQGQQEILTPSEALKRLRGR